ncbi:MAG: MbcA/ParS/Xre antitoxin family protein [Prevotellaceae bacterium]|jgi:putative toxin-antitoxin system antitoxin component (TIGR02293 family)|nr:MbcA/ParS/Xre antitoxin family protein [Prevotellaceae bacterium]
MKNTGKSKKALPKSYELADEHLDILAESAVAYGMMDNRGAYAAIGLVKHGVEFPVFKRVAKQSEFSLDDWAEILNISERTMQRYEQENKTFAPIYSEKILAIDMLMRYGADVFGSSNAFHVWLEANNVALGGITPRTLLDTSFGIDLIRNELCRIEFGVLA